MGRSGGPDVLSVDFDVVIDGFVALLRDIIGEPCLIVCHSMGGTVSWRLVELVPELVAGVVALAPADPGNIGPTAEVISQRDAEVTLRHPDSGIEFVVPTDRPLVLSREIVALQWIAGSTRFPREHAESFIRGLVPTPPKLVLQRLGAAGGLPAVQSTAAFDGLSVRVVCAPGDPGRTLEHLGRLVDLLKSWGADAHLIDLVARGIDGNGHFMFSELNSDEVLDLVLRETGLPGAEPLRAG
jgi:pimeloyl-ACP methyl ester carboxylesterase